MNANRKILIDFRVNGKHDHYTGCDISKFYKYAEKKVKNHDEKVKLRKKRKRLESRKASLCG